METPVSERSSESGTGSGSDAPSAAGSRDALQARAPFVWGQSPSEAERSAAVPCVRDPGATFSPLKQVQHHARNALQILNGMRFELSRSDPEPDSLKLYVEGMEGRLLAIIRTAGKTVLPGLPDAIREGL